MTKMSVYDITCGSCGRNEDPEFLGELARAEKALLMLRTGEARILNILSFFGSAEYC